MHSVKQEPCYPHTPERCRKRPCYLQLVHQHIERMPNISKQLVDALGCVSSRTGLFPVSVVFLVYLWQIQYDCAERRSGNLLVHVHLFQKKTPLSWRNIFIFDVAVLLPHTVRRSAACGLCACVRLTCTNTEQSRCPRLVPRSRGQERLSHVNCYVPRQHSPSISEHWSVPTMTPEKAH